MKDLEEYYKAARFNRAYTLYKLADISYKKYANNK
jgi:hypothetical protein